MTRYKRTSLIVNLNLNAWSAITPGQGATPFEVHLNDWSWSPFGLRTNLHRRSDTAAQVTISTHDLTSEFSHTRLTILAQCGVLAAFIKTMQAEEMQRYK